MTKDDLKPLSVLLALSGIVLLAVVLVNYKDRKRAEAVSSNATPARPAESPRATDLVKRVPHFTTLYDQPLDAAVRWCNAVGGTWRDNKQPKDLGAFCQFGPPIAKRWTGIALWCGQLRVDERTDTGSIGWVVLWLCDSTPDELAKAYLDLNETYGPPDEFNDFRPQKDVTSAEWKIRDSGGNKITVTWHREKQEYSIEYGNSFFETRR